MYTLIKIFDIFYAPNMMQQVIRKKKKTDMKNETSSLFVCKMPMNK